LDFTRNIFWLAICFFKIKKLSSHFLGNQSGIAGVCIIDTTDASMKAVFHWFFITLSSPEERFLYEDPSSSIGRMQLDLAASIVTPSPKKMDGNGDQADDDEPFINKRKPSSTTAVIGVFSNGPSPKKWMETATELSMTNFSSTRGSYQGRWL
jgi:hypothetical protein